MGPDFEIDEGFSIAKPVRFRRPWQVSVQRLTNAVFALACLSALVFMLSPRTTWCDWPRARQAQCVNNLKQIALALHGYHDKYGQLPPACVADATGRPLYSWRVLLLPFLDQSELYNQFDLGEPWNGPHNIKLLDKMPGLFACPSRSPFSRHLTNYVTIRGPGTMFPGTASVKFGEVIDGPNTTVMVAETASDSVPWTAPVDLDMRTMSLRINDPGRSGISSKHAGGANVVCGDASCHFFKDALAPEQLRSLIAIDDACRKLEADGPQY